MLAFLILGMFTVYLIDECWTPDARKETVVRVNSISQRTNGLFQRENQVVTSKGTYFNISNTEFLRVKKGESVIVFYTPWFHYPKYYQPAQKFESADERIINAGDARPNVVMFYLAAILFAAIIIISKKFEIRVGLSFLIIVMAAVKFWLMQIVE